MHHHHPFQESFWSPTSASDVYPDFSTGFNVLHSKLNQSLAENKVIIEYLEKRIQAERSHANNLSMILPTTNPFDNDIGGGLKRCFEVVFSESKESTKEHEIRAEDLFTTALDPLSIFSSRYERIITSAKQTVESQVKQFDLLCKQLDSAKSTYQNKCKALLAVQPHYNEENVAVVKVGTIEFPTRDHVWVWLQGLHGEELATREGTLAWIIATQSVTDQEAFLILQALMQQDFLKQQDNATSFCKLTPAKAGGFLGRWGKDSSSVNKLAEMMEADKNYRATVIKVEKMRTQVEQILFVHYEEMESLELERIQTVKQAFISVAASLSNTIPRCKETFDNMMLYQETLKPDKDVQVIVEQYRTGQFNPKPILYENYFCGTAKDQVFGVPLEEITKVQSTLVPQLVSLGLSVIESGFSRLYDEEKTVVWTTSLPLDRVHAAREEINHGATTLETLQHFDLLLLASVIRLYLMELPECLFTFELYEPCKLLYVNQSQQDKSSRLTSLSKLLATLPSPNYHTVMTLLGHFHKLVKELKQPKDLANSLAKSFSYILMRPQCESKVSAHDRHPQRLLQDLIENYDTIFTKETYKAQEENSNRPAIIIPETAPAATTTAKKSNSLDSTRTSTSSSTTRKNSVLSNFMRSSQSTPTSSISIKRNAGVIPMPSSSTLFEDPDEIPSSESSFVIHTPPSSFPNHYKSPANQFTMDDVASLDSFFEDED